MLHKSSELYALNSANLAEDTLTLRYTLLGHTHTHCNIYSCFCTFQMSDSLVVEFSGPRTVTEPDVWLSIKYLQTHSITDNKIFSSNEISITFYAVLTSTLSCAAGYEL